MNCSTRCFRPGLRYRGGPVEFLYSYYPSQSGKEILTAIKHDQFYVVYQPVVDAQSLRMTGLEVLMRWKHPVMGEIPPDAFINFAEAQKLIVPLTLHLLT